MKKFRYKKIKPKDVKLMKTLRDKGLYFYEIGKVLGVNTSTIQYHLKEKYRIDSIQRTKIHRNKLTKEQLKEKQLRQQPYRSEYMVDRYNNDEEFREKFKKMISDNFKKRQSIWREKGLCSNCGRARENKKWLMCKRCRYRKRKK